MQGQDRQQRVNGEPAERQQQRQRKVGGRVHDQPAADVAVEERPRSRLEA